MAEKRSPKCSLNIIEECTEPIILHYMFRKEVIYILRNLKKWTFPPWTSTWVSWSFKEWPWNAKGACFCLFVFIYLCVLFSRVSSSLKSVHGCFFPHFTCCVVKCRSLLVSLCDSSFPSEGGHVTHAQTGWINSGLDEFLIKSILSFAVVERPSVCGSVFVFKTSFTPQIYSPLMVCFLMTSEINSWAGVCLCVCG